MGKKKSVKKKKAAKPAAKSASAPQKEDASVVLNAKAMTLLNGIQDSERFNERTEAVLDCLMEGFSAGCETIKSLTALPPKERTKALQKQKAVAARRMEITAGLNEVMDRLAAIDGVGMNKVVFFAKRMEIRGAPYMEEMGKLLKALLKDMGGKCGPSEAEAQLVTDAFQDQYNQDLLRTAAELRGEAVAPLEPEDVFCLDCGLRKTNPDATHCPECGTEYGVEPETTNCGACGAIKFKGKPCVLCGSDKEVTLNFCTECGGRLDDPGQTLCDHCRNKNG